jgi:dipeptidyl-peptidase-4
MKLLRFLAAASAIAMIAGPASAAGQDSRTATSKQAPALTFERVFDSPSLSGPVPRSPKLSRDGRYLALLRNRPTDLQRYDLWAFDRQTG